MTHGTFEYNGWTLAYEEHGSGPRVTVLVHGLLLDANLNRGLARALARNGHRVILLDLLGHGRSDKPERAAVHRMDFYGDQIAAVLDHLDVDEAVVGGVSLGAGAALMAGHRHPARVRGMFLEMPVLENATPFAALMFVPLLLGMHYGGPLARLGTGLLRRLPRTGIETIDSFMNAGSLRPEEIKAVLHGLLMGPLAPSEDERRLMTTPTLILAHQSDPLHPHSDAARLARDLPNSTLLKAKHPLELRMTPARLTGEVLAFLDQTWAARPVNADGITEAG